MTKSDLGIGHVTASAVSEVANRALFLASADSDYAAGSTCVSDGGFMRMVAQGA